MSPESQIRTHVQRLGDLLKARGYVSDDDIERALAMQAVSGGRIGSALVRIGAVSEDNLLDVLAEQLNVPIVSESDFPDLTEVFRFMRGSGISLDWFIANDIYIWLEDEASLKCVAKDILNPVISETLPRFFPDKQINLALLSSMAGENLSRALEQEVRVDAMFKQSDDSRQLRELAEEAPVVELVNNVLSQAVDADASDVHVEPSENSFKVRFRIDGVLRDQFTQPLERFAAVASRLKLISGLDIAERRLPQDGRITIRVAGADLDLRVSTLPSVFGESIVLRLLPKNRESLTLKHLGLASDHLEMITQWAESSGGIVLVTGPTGSGKSTTLHAALAATNDGVRKIVTVEDPVEIQIDGITQVQVHSEIGYSFARALRAILRQDPDVIMIGEIRDLETAEISIQSALSGHLVLSTLHTNDAISSFTRLIDMGVEPFLVAAPVKGVQAQRLVRRICSACSQPVTPSEDVQESIAELPAELVGDLWRGAEGCEQCHGTGYRGRIGIYQMVPVDEEMQKMIITGARLDEMRSYAHQKGYRDVYQDGLIKASQGLTSIDEVVRVISSEEAS